jgi:hypothetical protein
MALAAHTAGCDDGLIGWAGTDYGIAAERASLLEKTREKQAGPVYGGRKPHLWSGSREIIGDYSSRYLYRGKHQMNNEWHFIKFLFKEAAPESS